MHWWTAASLLLLTCLYCCPAAALQATREYACDLTLVGCSGSRHCLRASLACQPQQPALEQPDLVVAYNSSSITPQQADGFRGVKLSTSFRQAPARYNNVFEYSDVWPLMIFETGDHPTVVHLRSPMIRDVRLSADAGGHGGRQARTCILLVARGAGKQTTVSIFNGTFSGNQADLGILISDSDSTSVTGDLFTAYGTPSGNNPPFSHYWDTSVSLTLANSQVIKNLFSVGCFWGHLSHVIINNSLFGSNNVTGDFGSLLYVFASHTTLDNVGFERNTASGYGGTIIRAGPSNVSLIIRDCLFRDNTADWGGAVVMDNAPLNVAVPFFGRDLGLPQPDDAAGLNNALLTRENQLTVMIQHTFFEGNSAVGRSSADNTRCDGPGGALYIMAGNATVVNSSFTWNSACTGGGIYAGKNVLGIDSWAGFKVISNRHVAIVGCFFGGNHANSYGGAVAADRGTSLQVFSTNFTSNVAYTYGGALAVDLNTSTEVNDSRFMRDWADSGGAVAAYVTTSQVVSQDQQTFRSHLGVPSLEPIVQPTRPIADLLYKSNYSLKISNSFFAANQAFSGHGQDIHAGPAFDLALVGCNFTLGNASVLWLRSNCNVGEYFDNTSAVCQNCSAYQYSLESHWNKPLGAVHCQLCPANAVCPGGAVILPETGHWHGPSSACATGAACKHTLDNVTRCPNPSACHHNPQSSALKALYPVGGRASDPSMPNYLQHLCGNDDGPYTGLLCGQCNIQQFYGQTAPFTCHKCLTKGREPETLDKPGISGLWFVYWFVFTGWLLFSTWSSLSASNNPTAPAESVTTGSQTAQPCRKMRTLDVWKAITVYKQYAQILLSLPMLWMPHPFEATAGGQTTTGSFGQQTWAAQALVIFSGSAASIDCMLSANGLHWSAEGTAGFKALFNALLAPLILYVSVVVLQLLWFFVRQPLKQLLGWVGSLMHPCSCCMSGTRCITTIGALFSELVPAPQWCHKGGGQNGCGGGFQACSGGFKALWHFCCWLMCCGCCGGHAIAEPGAEDSSNSGVPAGVAQSPQQQQQQQQPHQQQQPGPLSSAPASVVDASTPLAANTGETLAAYMREHLVVTFLSVVFQFYPSIARVALGMFFCTSLGDSSPGDSVWVMDVTLGCPTTKSNIAQHKWSLSIGILALMFCIAWPLTIATILVRAAHKQTNGIPTLQQHGTRIRTMFGFTYTDYKVEYSAFFAANSAWSGRRWWHVSWGSLGAAAVQHLILVWNAILDIQRFVLVIISFLVVLHEYYQVLILTVALVLYMVLLLWLQPFRVPAINRLQVLSLVSLSISCMLILFLMQPVGATSMTGLQMATIRWIIMAINIVYVLIAVLMLIRGVTNDCRQPDGQLHGLGLWFKKCRMVATRYHRKHCKKCWPRPGPQEKDVELAHRE